MKNLTIIVVLAFVLSCSFYAIVHINNLVSEPSNISDSKDLPVGVISEESAIRLFSGYGTEYCRVNLVRESDGALIAVIRNSSVILFNFNGHDEGLVLYVENGGLSDSTEFSFANTYRESDSAKHLTGLLRIEKRYKTGSGKNKIATGILSFGLDPLNNLPKILSVKIQDSCQNREGQFGEGKGLLYGLLKWIAH